MFAIEKNPSAVKILQIRNEDEWNGQVTVIHTDMRDWKPEEKLDIIISELLGENKIMFRVVMREDVFSVTIIFIRKRFI